MKTYLFLIVLAMVIGCSTKRNPTEEIVREIEELGGLITRDEADNVIYVNLSSSGVSSLLIERLSSFKHLQYLYLEHTNLENKDLEFIGKISSLEVLNINMTKATDEGLFFLLPLDNLKKLQMNHYSFTRPIPKELEGATVEDIISGKVQFPVEQDYGDGIHALMTKHPGLKTELWGGLPGPLGYNPD